MPKTAGDFGDRLKEVRGALDMTQKELASQLGVVSSYLSDIETNKVKPGLEFIRKVTGDFKINPSYLIHGKGGIFSTNVQKPPKDDLDFGENSDQVKKLLYYMKNSSMVKFSMLEHFRKYLLQHKTIIEEDIKEENEKDQNGRPGQQ